MTPLLRLLLPLLLLMQAASPAHAAIRVLAIGVSQYPEASGWQRINAANDLRLIRSIFPDAEILEDSAATHAAITNGLNTLTRTATAGDTVIIHFSGHGQQIITENSSHEIDGIDEALVPYDAAKRLSATYTGQYHLTDDSFGAAIDRIRRAIGPHGLVMALIDAGHSDTMDKDTEGYDGHDGIYRGTDEIFGADRLPASRLAALKESYHNQDTAAPRSAPEMSRVVYLSACRSDRRNYEVTVGNQGYGALTYYFHKAYCGQGLSDMPKFLSAIHEGMAADRTLRFHRQLPSIRNTIGWQAPEPPTAATPPTLPPADGADGPAATWVILSPSAGWIALTLSAAIAAVILILTIIQHRNRHRNRQDATRYDPTRR